MHRYINKLLLLLVAGMFMCCSISTAEQSDFYVKPYLQLGAAAPIGDRTSMKLVWFARAHHDWKVTLKKGNEAGDSTHTKVSELEVLSGPVKPLYRVTCEISDLKLGSSFDYQVSSDQQIVFSAMAETPKSANQPFV